jgi:glutaconate CoA-transferase subunit A
MTDRDLIVSVDALAGEVADGTRLALPKDLAGAPMEAVRALIRGGVRDLRLITVPTNGWATEWLVGAGATTSVETSGVSLGEFGGAPRFNAAVKQGSITIKDATCPAIYAALQAGEKGQPFVPLRGVIGSDVLAHRDDWKVMPNPFAEDSEDPVLLLPAIRPEVSLFHARCADRNGNVYVGIQRELTVMAHASQRTLVTVEEIVDHDLMASEERAAGCIPAIYISAIAVARNGAWPLGFLNMYDDDEAHLADYARVARSEDGFTDYMSREVFGARQMADA